MRFYGSSFFMCKLYKEYINYENIQCYSSYCFIMKLTHKSLHENLRKTRISLKEEPEKVQGNSQLLMIFRIMTYKVFHF